MNDELDDDIAALLRDGFGGPVPDEGFCDRVMQQLPATRRNRAWPTLVGIAGGAAASGISLVSAPIMASAWNAWLAGPSAQSVLALMAAGLGLSTLALAWALAEVQDTGAVSTLKV